MATTYTARKYPTMPTYSTPEYNEKKYSKGVDTSFYKNAINSYTAQANKERQTQIGEARKNQTAALKQAYVNRLQNQRNLNLNLAQSGIRGGATESSNIKLANTYGQAVSAANADYANSVNSINQSIDRNIFDYTADMNARAEEYRQNQANARWQAAREDALNRYNAQREDRQNQYNAQRENDLNEYNSAVEYWSNYYTDRYSYYSEKDAKNALKAAQKAYASAKTDRDKLIQLQKIRGITNRLGVIKSSK